MDLLASISEWARVQPDRIAHRSAGGSLSWGELIRRADALAAHLVATLPDDGSPVALLGHKESEMLVGFLGAAKAGHPYVPIDSTIPPARAEIIVRTAGASLVLTPPEIGELSARL